VEGPTREGAVLDLILGNEARQVVEVVGGGSILVIATTTWYNLSFLWTKK